MLVISVSFAKSHIENHKIVFLFKEIQPEKTIINILCRLVAIDH